MERRLAAILAADVVGYSALMETDEEATLVTLSAYRQVIDGLVTDHRGRVFGSAGDSVIAEFASPVEAVRCAAEIQLELKQRSANLAEDRRMRFRIGVNLGDVVVEGDNLFGDGVNVAARLQALADPGGIYVSGTVFDQVEGKLDFGFDDLGAQQVKNIAKPVRIYRVSFGESRGAADVRVSEPLPLPDKPSIAVLPFANMSGDPEQEYFSDGITEDIITELSRFRSLFVIARNSSFAFKDQSIDVAEIGRKLGVRYIVEGSVRKAGNRVRISAQLIEAAAGNHLWAERYDRELEDIFAIQDEVTQTIVGTVVGRLEYVAREQAEHKPPANLDAYDLLLRGLAHRLQWSPEDSRVAKDLLERAIELDPNYAAAYAALAETNFVQWFSGWHPNLGDCFDRFCTLAERSVSLDDADSRTHTTAGYASLHRRDYDRARFHLERALALNPNDTRALVNMARFDLCTGNSERAIQRVKEANRLNPFAKHGWYHGMAYYTARRHDEALVAFGSIRNPVAMVHAWTAASLAQAGREEEATRAAGDFMTAAKAEMSDAGTPFPVSWAAFIAARCPYQGDEDESHLLDGLRKAGVRE